MKRIICTIALTTLAFACDRKPATDTTSASSSSTAGTASQTTGDAAPVSEIPIIDAHTHINPLAFGPFLKMMDEHNLSRVINMSGGSSPDRRQDAIARAEEAAPQRIALFHNVDWTDVGTEGWIEREVAALERSAQMGFAGMKVSKALGLGVMVDDEILPVDSPLLAPIWDTAGTLGLPVGIHTGDPKAFFEPPTPDNERYAELSVAPGWSFHGEQFPSRRALLDQRDRMVAAHPDTTFILLHFANNPEDVDYVDALLEKHDNVYVDIAARIGEIGRHDARRVRQIFEKHQDRIFFATDIQFSLAPTPDGRMSYRLTLGSISKEPPTLEDIGPFYTQHRRYFEYDGAPIAHPVPIQGDWKVNPIGLPEPILQKLYWKNAERVLFAPWLARRAAHRVATSSATR